VQKEAVAAKFKTIPEFSWKECEKPLKICQVSRSPKRAKYGLPN